MSVTSAKTGKIRTFARRFGPRVEASDREFLEPAREIIESPPSPIRMALAMAICAIVVISIATAIFGQIDIYAVAPGRIQPAGRTKVIQPIEDGKVTEVYVQDGSQVTEGQLLLELDPTESAADRAAADAQQEALAGEIARRRVAVTAARDSNFRPSAIAFPEFISSEVRQRENAVLNADLGRLGTTVGLLKAKITEANEKIRALEMTLSADRTLSHTLSRRVDMRQGLQRDGWDSQSNVLDADEDLQKTNTQIATEQGEIVETQAQLATARRQLDDSVAQFIDDNTTALDQAQGKFDENAQAVVKANAKLSHMRLVAPISGTVQQLAVTTLGQVVTTGQQLMAIVPSQASLEIEALVQNDDIGFVHTGQTAVIKINSFPFTRYGTVSGRVVRVSRDAVTSNQQLPQSDTEDKPLLASNGAATAVPKTQDLVFPVRVLLDRDTMLVDGQRVPLSPGMSASVEIRTGKRRVITYLLSPLVKTVSESGHER